MRGCAVEETLFDGGSLIAEIENDQTKKSVTDDDSFTWSEGDQIWLHTTSDGLVGTLTSGEGTSIAQSSFGSHFGEMTGKAAYPYKAGHSISGDILNVAMPASYDLGHHP